jgi:hypothetical protein
MDEMTFKLNLDAGANVAFDLSEDKVATLMGFPNVVEYMVWKGLKEILTDAHASVVRKDFKTDDEWIAAKRAKAELKLGALMVGEVRTTSRESKPKVDDFTNVARKTVLGKLPKEKRAELAAMPDKGVAILDAMFAKNDAVLRPIVEAELVEMLRKAEAAEALNGKLDLTF